MTIYTIFSKKSGKNLRRISKPRSDGSPGLNKDEIFFPGEISPDKILSINEKPQAISLRDKPESSIKMSQDAKGVLLENIENPTMIIITGNHASFRRVITDGEYEFSIDEPGEYLIKCESEVELPIEFKVTVR